MGLFPLLKVGVPDFFIMISVCGKGKIEHITGYFLHYISLLIYPPQASSLVYDKEVFYLVIKHSGIK